jgi:hypothetical protein
MRSLILFIGFYTLINLGFLVPGMVLGYLLHRLFPAVDLGIGILIGLVVTGLSVHFFVRLISFLESYDAGLEREEGLRRMVYYTLPSTSPRPKRKQKPK